MSLAALSAYFRIRPKAREPRNQFRARMPSAVRGARPPQIPQPDLVQQRLLDLLEIDPRKLADPPHLMCELRV